MAREEDASRPLTAGRGASNESGRAHRLISRRRGGPPPDRSHSPINTTPREFVAAAAEREREAQKRLAAQLFTTKSEVQAEQEELRLQKAKQERERQEMEARLEEERVQRERELYEMRLETIDHLFRKAVRVMTHQRVQRAWATWLGHTNVGGQLSRFVSIGAKLMHHRLSARRARLAHWSGRSSTTAKRRHTRAALASLESLLRDDWARGDAEASLTEAEEKIAGLGRLLAERSRRSAGRGSFKGRGPDGSTRR